MYQGLTEQMLGFSLAMQQIMTGHVQKTLVRQLEVFQTAQNRLLIRADAWFQPA